MLPHDELANIPGKWGLLAKYDNPLIRFLMDRKFPWLKRISSAPPPGKPVGARRGVQIEVRRTIIEDGKLTATGADDVARYEAELLALSRAALNERFNQEAAKAAEELRNAAEIQRQLQEKKLYGEWPAADFNHWLRVALWTADEAVDLSLGKSPDGRFGWNYISHVLQISEFAKTYEKRRLLIHRAIAAGDLPNLMRPERFMRWAIVLQLDPFPDALKPPSTLPAATQPHSKAQSRAQEVRSDSSIIRRGEFTARYASHIKGGEQRLKRFFDGQTRKSGEKPEAAPFRVPEQSGFYYLDRIIEYFRTRHEYSELEWD